MVIMAVKSETIGELDDIIVELEALFICRSTAGRTVKTIQTNMLAHEGCCGCIHLQWVPDEEAYCGICNECDTRLGWGKTEWTPEDRTRIGRDRNNQLKGNIMEMSKAQEETYSEMRDFGWEFDHSTDGGEVVMVMIEYLGESQKTVGRMKIEKSGSKADLAL